MFNADGQRLLEALLNFWDRNNAILLNLFYAPCPKWSGWMSATPAA